MIKKLIFTFALITYLIGISQSNSDFLSKNFDKLPQEKIHLHYNNDFLLTGETLYYKIYCLNNNKTNNTFSKYSKVAYIELINSKNEKVIIHKVNLINGSGYGDIFIDTKLKSGTYKLVSYTQWMRNQQSFFEKDIVIINPFIKKIESSNKPTTKINKLKISPNSLKEQNSILSNPLKKVYSTREKVSLAFFNDSTKYQGIFSISVKKKDDTNLDLNTLPSVSLSKTNNFYLPELRGTLIQGKINSKTPNKNISNIKLALSIKNSAFLTQTATTNNLGEFYFNVPNLNTNKVYIQILDEQKSNFEITLKENKGIEKNFKNFKNFTLNKELTEVIKYRSNYLQVENAYYTVKKDSIVNSVVEKMLLNEKIKTYKLDDYKRFKSMEETFIEIIDVARIFKRNEEAMIKVIDEQASETLSYLPSLLIVDGHILYNHTPFIDFDTRNINKINIIKNKYYYGNAIYQGVVIIETFKGDYFPTTKDLKEFNVTQVQPQKKYFFQRHDISNKRIPDFRTQLYWHPNLNTIQKEITFYTSDVTGDFEIDFQAFSKKGKLIHVKRTFSVK